MNYNTERTEAEYLQSKLGKITEDDLLDFHKLISMAPSVEGFIAHFQHHCAVGKSQPPTVKQGNPLALLFHCSACQRDFIGQYFYDMLNKEKPFCPECGSTIWVDEVK